VPFSFAFASLNALQAAVRHSHKQESKSNEAGIPLFVGKDQVPWAFPRRKFARKPCTSACERPPVSSLTFGRDFTPADVASKRRRPKSLGRHPRNEASEHLVSHLGPNPSSPMAKEEVLDMVTCQESTRTEDFTLKVKKTKAEPAGCRTVLDQGARSSVSHAFVRTRQVETKKGGACYKSPPSRKTQEAPHCRRWSLSSSSTLD
jgi:hypothetical protein